MKFEFFLFNKLLMLHLRWWRANEFSVASMLKCDSSQLLTVKELQDIEEACDMASELNSFKTRIYEYVESRMTFIAPNMSAILGASTAAKIMGGSVCLQHLEVMITILFVFFERWQSLLISSCPMACTEYSSWDEYRCSEADCNLCERRGRGWTLRQTIASVPHLAIFCQSTSITSLAVCQNSRPLSFQYIFWLIEQIEIKQSSAPISLDLGGFPV